MSALVCAHVCRLLIGPRGNSFWSYHVTVSGYSGPLSAYLIFVLLADWPARRLIFVSFHLTVSFIGSARA